MPHPRPMRADARRNRERLLTAAASAFAEHGENASLDDIARRAGVGSGTLYRHFPTRRALLEAAYSARVDALGERGEELSRALPPGEALTEWLHEVCVATIQVRGLKSLLGSAVTDADAPMTACGTVVNGTAARLVRSAQEEGTLRPDITPAELLRLAHGIASAAELGGGEAREIGRYLGWLLDGVRRRPPHVVPPERPNRTGHPPEH
ncbi:TetR/AcrR family transcriptional regulator [Streptomyces seoulensis]|uniref:TetR/AcrR family transcriptional regulator n=1 Tax=Streptomyces seoulensis TaxID=73044 RepID=UPI001FCCA124|nr:TetR/AcrR family transcriptional regulator [Streptomyces seoulensis]BDH04411.1 transcriptional regulator [Streptomyces seoulensis]